MTPKRKHNPVRLLLIACFVFIAVVLSGCAAPTPYEPPVDKLLQDPLPGQAIVYLLRAPYDDETMEIVVSGRKVAVLPGSTYTALSLPPGRHLLQARSRGVFGAEVDAAQAVELELLPDQRRFLYVSGTTENSFGYAGLIPLGRGAVVPLFLPRNVTDARTRTWKEMTELDAQGLMSISRLVLPARSAP